MDKIKLKNNLEEGLSYRQIAELEKCSPKKIEYWVNVHNLKFYSKNNREYQKHVEHDFFKKIDTPEKAYIAGFILGYGDINDRFDVNLGVALGDIEILRKIANELPWDINISVDKTFDKKARRYPRAWVCLRSRKIGKDLTKHLGSRLTSERRTPIIQKKLEPYLVSGFFDADGCITWGYRKDRNRLWHKISFTASISTLIGIQNILLKNGISSAIKPKKNENVHIIEFSNKGDIIKTYNLLKIDGIRLNRKMEKFDQLINIIDVPLRSESDEFGENSLNRKNNTEPSTISV